MADVKMVIPFAVDVNAPLTMRKPVTLLMEGDKAANVLQIALFDGATPVNPSGYTVGGYLTRADGSEVDITGEIAGNTVRCTLNEYCYAVPGPYVAYVQLIKASERRTILLIGGQVQARGHGPMIDTGRELPTLEGVIAQINEAKAAADAANAAAARAPYIGPNNVWYAWSPSAQMYVSTGVPAVGTGVASINGQKPNAAGNVTLALPQNWLKNSNLSNPVFQRRGKSDAAGLVYRGAGYRLDCWLLDTEYTTMTRGERYTLFAASGGGGRVRQYIEPETLLRGKPLTVAVCTNAGNVTAASGVLPETLPELETTFASANLANNIVLRLTQLKNGRISFRLDLPDGSNIALRWAAVYPGAFSADNMPDYIYPDYWAEYTACRMHFRRTVCENTYAVMGAGMARSETTAWVQFPRERMRIGSPTVQITGNLLLYCGNMQNSVTATKVALDKISDTYLRCTVTVSGGLTSGTPVVAMSDTEANFCIDESADY